MRQKFGDPIGIVESLYRFDLPAGAWLELVADRLRGTLDRYGLGVFGGIGQWQDACTYIPGYFVDRCDSDGLRAAFFRDLRALSPAFVADGLLSRTVYLGADLRGWMDIPGVSSGELAGLGGADLLAINASEPDGSTCTFISFQAERAPLSDEAHLALVRIARHLVAANRLRSRLNGSVVSPALADAVIDPGGRVHHVSAVAKSRIQPGVLERAAKAMDRARCRSGPVTPLEAIDAWKCVVDRGWTLVEHFERDGRRYLLALDNRTKSRGAHLLSEREREVVVRALAGQHDKAIAYDLGVADSTVRVLMMRAARKVGARSRSELLHALASEVAPGDAYRRPL